MKTLNRKTISIALLISLGAIFSVNVNAAQTTSIENSISEMVMAQGQQVMSDLTEQLQQSISKEINSFRIDFSLDETITESLAWIGEETGTSTLEEARQVKQLEENPSTEIEFLK